MTFSSEERNTKVPVRAPIMAKNSKSKVLVRLDFLGVKEFHGCFVFLVGDTNIYQILSACRIYGEERVHAVVKDDRMKSFVFQVPFDDICLEKGTALGYCFHDQTR